MTKSTFPLPGLGVKLESTRKALHHGIGFQVVRGLEVDKYSAEDIATVFLGLSRYIGADCGSQDREGTMMSMCRLCCCVRRTTDSEPVHIMDNHPTESQNDLVGCLCPRP